MLPGVTVSRYRLCGPLRNHASALVLALACACWTAPVAAQDAPMGAPDASAQPTDTATPDAAPAERQIDFEANELAYDSERDVVTASGDVFMRSEGKSVRADSVSWDRKSGQILAEGNVRFVDEDGNQLYTQSIELTDKFEAGSMSDLLLALREGGRLAAREGQRNADGTVELSYATYSACSVIGVDGCPKDPSWRVTAKRVTYDPQNHRVRFQGAVLELFGARILPMPGLAVRTDGRAVSGFLLPDLRVSRNNGIEVNANYYWRLAENKDLTAGAYIFSSAVPLASAQYRQLTDNGAFQITGYLTQSRRIDLGTGVTTSQRDVRGYIFANGKFQLDPNWSVTASVRRASDRTFLRRYDISRDDRLRSTLDIERIDDDSYFEIAGWATQTLRVNQPQGQVPLALPVIDYRRRLADPVLGGKVELQANSLFIARDTGQDTQRAFASAQWDLRRITGLGQVITLTGLVRGDVYHTDETGLTATASYRGNPGWQARGVALAAVDMSWPFVGSAFGGTQTFTPRIQLVASPPISNLSVPNEDSRAVDLEDTNLFSLNRFPGYDRVEDGPRVTYGFNWQLDIPGWRLEATFGQSYRLDNKATILPDGTGLSDRASDYVGRTVLRYRNLVKITHRFRLDKDNFAVRRNEFDATVGSEKTYVEVGYLRLNRDITTVEDLQDREELRVAGRVAFANYWSVFGSGVFNLTDRNEDPTLTSDGFDPLRTRLGVAYSDDCLEFGITWRRDYVNAGDARRGNTFQLHFALKTLGFQ
ncbi:MAG: LPS-assembly protein LptD [Sphingomonadales bacterium]|nr:LPS-assembly protein LptD [Sphingomonadales bacterium]MBD3772548.1 LPS-assembly protein LptD [Paracoccaceae bacterium]